MLDEYIHYTEHRFQLETPMIRPLDGYKVLDLTHVLAGPYCTYQLGLLGASVTKVESPKGDMVRGWGGTEEQLAMKIGTGFAAQNAGKKSISVDITKPDGAEIVSRLAENADIMVENYRPGALAQYCLGYEDIKAINPGIIYVSISAFGQNGPLGHRPGFDDVVQANSGFMSINVRGDGPIRTGGPVLDYATGMHAASSVLAAVLLKERTGESQRIDLAMQDVTMLLINHNTHITASTGVPPEPAGNREGFLLGRYEAKSGYVMLAGYLPHHQRSICAAIGLAEFAEFSGKQFSEFSDKVERAVDDRLLEKTAMEWDKIFSEAGVVAGGVHDLKEVLETGQPEARELLTKVDTSAGPVQVSNAGYLINGDTFRPNGPVPLLGGDTKSILGELGYSSDQIDRWLSDKVVVQA